MIGSKVIAMKKGLLCKGAEMQWLWEGADLEKKNIFFVKSEFFGMQEKKLKLQQIQNCKKLRKQIQGSKFGGKTTNLAKSL